MEMSTLLLSCERSQACLRELHIIVNVVEEGEEDT
jgi:hypothetical protein